ncbi:MAG: OB-fold nucleic acid binding domain-containing protein, partial [Dehalococcoidia bacterium]|nr:OB-fold nucleic acid binding domain-containing protein [Dehalococcoidia bacterium]
LESLKEDARRHGIAVLNPDVNLSGEKCVIDEGLGSRVQGSNCFRLGLLSVRGVGEAAAGRVVSERETNGPYRSLADLIRRAGLLREALENLAEAGALDAFGPDRRLLRWEIGLRYRPPSTQLTLSLPVEQDLAPLPELSPWEMMEGEYRTMGLYPKGHMLAQLRPSLPGRVYTSHEVQSLADGVEVTVAGLVIRRQRPGTASGTIFLTLEDEFGHIPCVVWPQVYQRYRLLIKEPVLLARGAVSRRDGAMNVVVQHVEAVQTVGTTPRSKDWG